MKNPNLARTTHLNQPRVGGKFIKRSDAVVQRDAIIGAATEQHQMQPYCQRQPTMSDALIRPDGLEWTNCDGDAMAIEAANRVAQEDTAAVAGRGDAIRITWEDIAWVVLFAAFGVGAVAMLWVKS